MRTDGWWPKYRDRLRRRCFLGSYFQCFAPNSAHDPTALAGDLGTDIGNVGRDVLRGPSQNNVDFSVGKRIPLTEPKSIELHADFFNLFNHANRGNLISDISTVDFGKVLSFSSTPRIVQFALKFSF